VSRGNWKQMRRKKADANNRDNLDNGNSLQMICNNRYKTNLV
jgi:hypothetical protein